MSHIQSYFLNSKEHGDKRARAVFGPLWVVACIVFLFGSQFEEYLCDKILAKNV